MSAVGPKILEISAVCGDQRCKMLVDTGSAITILPLKFENKLNLRQTAVKLTAANGNMITTKGEALIDIHIPGLQKTFRWMVVVADVVNPILGYDFLSQFDIHIDCRNNRIIDSNSKRSLKADVIVANIVQINVNKLCSIPEVAQSFIDKYN